MNLRRKTVLILLCYLLYACSVSAQIGGKYAFESSSLPTNARLTALGGSLISIQDDDIALALINPSLHNARASNQLSINHNFHFAGISFGNVTYGTTLDSLGISVHGSIQYVSYGDFDLSDEIGNINGQFSANEVQILIGAAKQLNERIRLGANIKYLSAGYESYGAAALGLDLGLHYQKPGSNVSWGILLRNIGREINPLVDETKSLPFDLQIGYSRKLAHLPFRFSIIGHQLQKWYIRYDDPDFDTSNTLIGETTEISSFNRNLDNLFRHIIVNGEFLIGKSEQFRLRFGYNHLRKRELRTTSFRSLGGFSFGVGFNIKKIKIDYGIGHYHIAGANNHLSLRLDLGRFFDKV